LPLSSQRDRDVHGAYLLSPSNTQPDLVRGEAARTLDYVLTQCPRCGAKLRGQSPACASCGFLFPRMSGSNSDPLTESPAVRRSASVEFDQLVLGKARRIWPYFVVVAIVLAAGIAGLFAFAGPSDSGSDQASTVPLTSVVATPDTSSVPSTIAPSTSPSVLVVDLLPGDLGFPVRQLRPACTGAIVVVGQSDDPSVDRVNVPAAIDANQGSAYLQVRDSCASLATFSPTTYVVFMGPYPTRQAACDVAAGRMVLALSDEPDGVVNC
jgi:hypothetical protein